MANTNIYVFLTAHPTLRSIYPTILKVVIGGTTFFTGKIRGDKSLPAVFTDYVVIWYKNQEQTIFAF